MEDTQTANGTQIWILQTFGAGTLHLGLSAVDRIEESSCWSLEKLLGRKLAATPVQSLHIPNRSSESPQIVAKSKRPTRREPIFSVESFSIAYAVEQNSQAYPRILSATLPMTIFENAVFMPLLVIIVGIVLVWSRDDVRGKI